MIDFSNMPVVAYIRVSSAGQLSGDGPERQICAIENFIAKERLKLQRVFQEAVSGTVDGLDRPEFTALLEFIDMRLSAPEAINLPIRAVVIERLDRLARDLMVQEVLIRELKKRGVMLYACDQGLIDIVDDSNDPTRKLIRQVLGALAEWEKSCLVRKLAVARARVKAETGRCGGGIPYGRKDGEAPVLDLMHQLRDTMSLRGMADFLNNGGFRQRNGKLWSFSAISNILNHTQRKEG